MDALGQLQIAEAAIALKLVEDSPVFGVSTAHVGRLIAVFWRKSPFGIGKIARTTPALLLLLRGPSNRTIR
ncbi:hypothetical protein GCM10011335_33810 [Aureimonas glaciei]|uniref:Uncharacterized protein n=1 Tax=Aureimonas glaciei TaxID=1776957 RepID=A0A916Y355_9HYPH|nr:hypothetical protein GCM10011335_33810 [Aureimonas glaciei]